MKLFFAIFLFYLSSNTVNGAPQREVSSASSQCPSIDSHDVAPIRYQLFTAYQTGLDGFELVCENICLGKLSCKSQCQQKKGLDFLAKEMVRLHSQYQVEQCQSFTTICQQQCQDLGDQCTQSCQPNKT
jgi:hypothetical protein